MRGTINRSVVDLPCLYSHYIMAVRVDEVRHIWHLLRISPHILSPTMQHISGRKSNILGICIGHADFISIYTRIVTSFHPSIFDPCRRPVAWQQRWQCLGMESEQKSRPLLVPINKTLQFQLLFFSSICRPSSLIFPMFKRMERN